MPHKFGYLLDAAVVVVIHLKLPFLALKISIIFAFPLLLKFLKQTSKQASKNEQEEEASNTHTHTHTKLLCKSF